MPHVASIQVAVPTEYGTDRAADPMDQRWLTSFYKLPVTGPVKVHEDRLEGNEQADLRFHGGVDKALLAYSADHYPLWQEELGLSEMEGGGFGENLTITGQTEETVCLGDRYSINNVILEISQPRQPCWKLARRWRVVNLPKRVIQTGRSGWYFRVIQIGAITAGQEVTLMARPHPDWPLSRVNQVFYARNAHPADRRELASLPELADAWRVELV
jgi:MOSC domain-containing protein YiiM